MWRTKTEAIVADYATPEVPNPNLNPNLNPNPKPNPNPKLDYRIWSGYAVRF